METKYEIIFFENENGEKPAYEFILKADKKMKAKIFSNLYELEMHGHKLREPYSKHLTGGIFELRSRVGTNSARVLYFFHYGRRIILTNGFVKKTNKTPMKEILLAIKYKKTFLKKLGDEVDEK